MKILSPVSDVAEVEPLHNAGATEIYCGIMSADVRRQDTSVFAPNARQLETANLGGIGDLRAIADRAHQRGMKVFVTYNIQYSASQLARVTKEVEDTLACGVDGLIVADISLVMHLHQRHPKALLIISTYGGSFNSHTARVYRDLGASRVVLPRHLKVGEIREIADACPDVDFEVFVMSEGCYFPNALCHFEHATYAAKNGLAAKVMQLATSRVGLGIAALGSKHDIKLIVALQDRFTGRSGPMCCRDYRADLLQVDGSVVRSNLPFRFVDSFRNHADACGLCSISEIAGIPNVCALKIVGRQHPTDRKCADTAMVNRALKAIGSATSQAAFIDAAKAIRKDYLPSSCGPSFCYFRESFCANKPAQRDGSEAVAEDG